MTLYTFPFCRVAVLTRENYIETQFPDGCAIRSSPTTDTDSRLKAVELGYSEDLWEMIRDHELAYTWLAFCRGEPWSKSLWFVAHDRPKGTLSIADRTAVTTEELEVLRFLRTLNKDLPRPWDVSPFVQRTRFMDWTSTVI